MSVVYVVRPEQRGVTAYNTPSIEHSWTTPPRLDVFNVEQPFLPPVVQRCVVRPNSVCEHGWFCTDNQQVAEMVEALRAERPSVVAYLDLCARAVAQLPGRAEFSLVAEHALRQAADGIDRGDHLRLEE